MGERDENRNRNVPTEESPTGNFAACPAVLVILSLDTNIAHESKY